MVSPAGSDFDSVMPVLPKISLADVHNANRRQITLFSCKMARVTLLGVGACVYRQVATPLPLDRLMVKVDVLDDPLEADILLERDALEAEQQLAPGGLDAWDVRLLVQDDGVLLIPIRPRMTEFFSSQSDISQFTSSLRLSSLANSSSIVSEIQYQFTLNKNVSSSSRHDDQNGRFLH